MADDAGVATSPTNQPSGRCLAALILAMVSLALAAMAWVTWFFLAPSGSGGWFAYTPLRGSAQFHTAQPPGGARAFGTLAVGAVWYATVPVAVVGTVLARISARYAAGSAPTKRVARMATVTAVFALVVALIGVVVFGLALSP